jgi:hypothetical protein
MPKVMMTMDMKLTASRGRMLLMSQLHRKKIEQFFIDKGFTERHGGKVWSVYWSNILVTPDTCPSEQYSTVWGHNSISIELISVSRGC